MSIESRSITGFGGVRYHPSPLHRNDEEALKETLKEVVRCAELDYTWEPAFLRDSGFLARQSCLEDEKKRMTLEYLISQYGYVALFIGVFLEGETILILAGFAAHLGHLKSRLGHTGRLCRESGRGSILLFSRTGEG